MPIIFADEHHAMGTCENFVVFVWRGQTHAAGMRDGSNALAQLIPDHPDGVGVMHVVEPQAVPPDSAAREILFDMIRRSTPPLVGSSVVAEGAGFRGAFVRSIVTGMTLLARFPSPLRVFAAIDEAIDWHVEIGATRQERRHELPRFVGMLRARIDEVTK